MEQIIAQLLGNKPLTILLITLGVLLLVWVLIKTTERYFADELTFLLQNSILLSLIAFKITVTIILLSIIWGFIYLIKANFLYGIIPTVFLGYLLYRIFVMRNKQSELIETEFQLQKYSTRLSYIKDSDFNSNYRKKVYSAIINKIELIDLNSKNATSEFLLTFSKIYTFDNFNRDIENSESKCKVRCN